MAENLKITKQERMGFYGDMSKQEFERRIRRLREEMTANGVDGLLLTQESNVRYAGGFYEVGWIVPAYFYMVLIPRDPEKPMAIFVPESDQIQTQASWIETVIRWDFPVGFFTGNVGGDLVRALSVWMKKIGLARAKISTELGAHFRIGLSVECFDSIRATLPGITWVDCENIIWAVRCIKSDEEVRRLREAARISCMGVRAGFEAIRQGVSERDLANIMVATMHANGGSQVRFLSLYASPDRALWADSIPRREAKMEKGSLLQFDGGCTYDGYFADFKRFACLGEPTADQKRFFAIARASEQAGIDAIAPGVPFSAAYEASQQAIRDAGYSEFVDWCQKEGLTSIGHNIGLDIHEMPGISKGNDKKFEPNMVVCVEPWFWHDGRHPFWVIGNKYGCEDMVLVTKNGHEILTKESIISRDMWIV